MQYSACCILQEQLSIKTPLGECFWVFFISFCKCHGKYSIYKILFALCFNFVFRMNCWTFHHKDYWKQMLFQLYFLILQKLPTNAMQAKGRNRWAIGDFFCNWIILERCNQNPFKHLRWSFLQKTVNGFKLLTNFHKRLHLGCLIGFTGSLCELLICSWFKFMSWLPLYVSFTKNELLYWLFQGFVKIWNKLFNDFPEYLPMVASVDKTKN